MQPDSAIPDEGLRQALDAAPDGIAVIGKDGIILFVNQMMERLFEYEHDDLVGLSVDELLPERVRELHVRHRGEYVSHPRTRSMGAGLELRGRRRTGVEFPVEISLSPLHTANGFFVVAVVRDVTERRAAEEELNRAHEELALVDDRERIARDLHDTVIQRLFAVGLSLQGAVARVSDREVGERIAIAIDEIDATIRDIRSSIFALNARRHARDGIREEVLSMAREAARALGFEPTARFDGPVESVMTDEIREHVLATLREGLSNVTKHAHASAVEIDVEVNGREICLRIADNGLGLDDPGIGNGLRNMRERARSCGGDCVLSTPASGRGTQIEWSVPIDGNG